MSTSLNPSKWACNFADSTGQRSIVRKPCREYTFSFDKCTRGLSKDDLALVCRSNFRDRDGDWVLVPDGLVGTLSLDGAGGLFWSPYRLIARITIEVIRLMSTSEARKMTGCIVSSKLVIWWSAVCLLSSASVTSKSSKNRTPCIVCIVTRDIPSCLTVRARIVCRNERGSGFFALSAPNAKHTCLLTQGDLFNRKPYSLTIRLLIILQYRNRCIVEVETESEGGLALIDR